MKRKRERKGEIIFFIVFNIPITVLNLVCGCISVIGEVAAIWRSNIFGATIIKGFRKFLTI